MRTSLIITTYNWPEALDLTLGSVARQSVPPDEVVVADDGSGPATVAVLERWRQRLAMPMQHVWQADEGFHLARSRNRAIAAAQTDYIVLVDGDMILQQHLNGYDERFDAWGPEDREFAARLLHIGVRRNYVRHRAIAFHLHHPTRAPAAGVNPLDRLLQDTLAARTIWSDHGINASSRREPQQAGGPAA